MDIEGKGPLPDRADRMLERVRRTARELGLSADAVELLDAVHRTVMAPRVAALDDDHDPRYLHPGRTAAILMDDLGLRDADWIAAALATDTMNPEFEVDRSALPDAAGEYRGAIPRPDADNLVEDLLALGSPALDVVLAERLDHLRHLHLWDDAGGASEVYRNAVHTYSCVAPRAHPTLARRYAWWTRKFGSRFAT